MQDYSTEQSAISDFLTKKRTAAEIKGIFAPYGIYQQKNGLFMMRLRINAGRLTPDLLRNTVAAAKFSKAAYLHLTTRQDIQLHDVQPEKIIPVMKFCQENGMPFRGGGGDTFRNITSSPLSGIRKTSVFDVLPYAEELKRYLFTSEKAFKLPRKIKIGMFDAPEDEWRARIQDLGFLATVRNGTKGFKVWGGGGIGNQSAEGILLLDFIPALDAAKAADAMVNFFFDHGNRENRAEARIRFMVKKMGADEFRKLFMDYFSKSGAPALIPMPEKKKERILPRSFSAHLNPGLSEWKNSHTAPSRREGESIVLIRIPYGNMKVRDLENLLRIMEKYSLSEYRLTPDRTLCCIDFPEDALPALYDDLLRQIPHVDTTLKSFKGQIVTCIGNTVCKIGAMNSPELGDRVAKRLDEYFSRHPEEKWKRAAEILGKIRISGCRSCCTAHPAADIGLNGSLANGIKGWQFSIRKDSGQILGERETNLTTNEDAEDKIISLLNLKD